MKYWILLLTACALITSCNVCTGKQVSCPAFDDELFTTWFPYSQNQQLVFSSLALNDTFHISRASRSGSYNDTVTARSPYCIAEASFTTNASNPGEAPPFNILYNISHDEFANKTEKYIRIRVKNRSFDSKELSDTGLVNDFTGYLQTHYKVTDTIGSKAYTNVQQVSVDTTSTSFKLNEVYKFWLAKHQGIVAYEEYHGNLYVKQ